MAAIAWRIDSRRTVVVPSAPYPAAIAREYEKSIRRIGVRIWRWAEVVVPKLLPGRTDSLRADDDRARGALIELDDLLSEAFDDKWAHEQSGLASKAVDRHNASANYKEIGKALGIDVVRSQEFSGPILKDWVAANSDLIQSVRESAIYGMRADIEAAFEKGMRWEELRDRWVERGLPLEFGTLEGRASVIARTEVGKLNARLTEARQRDLGVDEFVWRTVGDLRVRDEHRARNGKRYTWDGADLKPGEAVQCRCQAEAVLDLDAVESEIAPAPTLVKPRPVPQIQAAALAKAKAEQEEKEAAAAKANAAKEAAAFAQAHGIRPDRIVDVDRMKRVGGQRGSNPGGLFEDESGQQWYVKTPPNADHIRSEVLASKLYEAAGVNVAEVHLTTFEGKVALASKIEKITAVAAEEIAALKGAHSGFAVDAWLANWDVVGLDYDNIASRNGVALRLDVGGALEFRAQGAPKGSLFGTVVGEIDTLRSPTINPQTHAVFGSMADEDIAASMARLRNVSPRTIRAVVGRYGYGTQEQRDALTEKLIARRADVIERQLPALEQKIASEKLAKEAAEAAARKAKEAAAAAEKLAAKKAAEEAARAAKAAEEKAKAEQEAASSGPPERDVRVPKNEAEALELARQRARDTAVWENDTDPKRARIAAYAKWERDLLEEVARTGSVSGLPSAGFKLETIDKDTFFRAYIEGRRLEAKNPVGSIIPSGPVHASKGLSKPVKEWVGKTSEDALKAFRAWTGEHFTAMRGIESQWVNKDIEKSPHNIGKYRLQIAQMREAMQHAPRYEGKVMRGINLSRAPDEVKASYGRDLRTPGAIIDQPHPASWSHKRAAANNFAQEGEHSYVLTHVTKRGVSIDNKQTSDLGTEEGEVMIDRGRFRVVSSTWNEKKRQWEVTVEDLQ